MTGACAQFANYWSRSYRRLRPFSKVSTKRASLNWPITFCATGSCAGRVPTVVTRTACYSYGITKFIIVSHFGCYEYTEAVIRYRRDVSICTDRQMHIWASRGVCVETWNFSAFISWNLSRQRLRGSPLTLFQIVIPYAQKPAKWAEIKSLYPSPFFQFQRIRNEDFK